MQSCTCSKTVLVWFGKLLIGSLLIGSLGFSTSSVKLNAASLLAYPCTLAWDVCTNSTVTGYAIYYGVVGSTTTNRLDAGSTNRATFKNLCAFTNYFFYAVTYNASGIESPGSSVIYYAPLAVSSVKLAAVTNGAMNVWFLVGTNTACHIEYTPTLTPVQWQPLCSATADANGKVSITDSLTGKPPSRYYRAAVP